MTESKSDKSMSRGGRNLVILGIVSIFIAIVTTGVSLLIYHNSGDIYLDRSRPGFLPDEDELKDQEDQIEDFVFEKNGEMTMGVLEEYIEALKKEITTLDAYTDSFDEDVLLDKALGI